MGGPMEQVFGNILILATTPFLSFVPMALFCMLRFWKFNARLRWNWLGLWDNFRVLWAIHHLHSQRSSFYWDSSEIGGTFHNFIPFDLMAQSLNLFAWWVGVKRVTHFENNSTETNNGSSISLSSFIEEHSHLSETMVTSPFWRQEASNPDVGVNLTKIKDGTEDESFISYVPRQTNGGGKAVSWKSPPA